LLGKTRDELAYTKLAADVKQAYNKAFFNPQTKQYGTGSQTANAISVYMGLVESGDKPSVINNIVKDLKARNNALTAGDIGFRYLVQVLDDAGRSDIVYAMNNRSDVPGYGYQLAHGATSLTESWAALPAVSNNHLMLGHIMEWFYGGLAGIRQAPGSIAMNKIEIRPQPVGDVTYAKASYNSPYGIIVTDWKKNDGKFDITIQIPANTSAVVYLPSAKNASVTEGGEPISANKSIKLSGYANGKAIIKVGSGTYHFISHY